MHIDEDDGVGRIKNVSGKDRPEPRLNGRVIPKGQEIDVPADMLTEFLAEKKVWAPVDATAKEAASA